jgi:pimeloyl-ACP methyl ester carboxylesterase
MNDVRGLPVIVVHGLWVHGLVMEYLAHQLKQNGFDAHTWSYPTMRQSLTENAEHLAQYCESLGVKRLNIVAHSMGGLVAMKMLECSPAIQCERLLLLGTPYTDSAAARRLAQFPGGDWLLGRSIREWLDEKRPRLQARQAGVIAGTRGIGLGALIGADLPQPHDGVVAVEETAVPGITEHIAVHVGHTEMLFSSEVARQCCAFLRQGFFAREKA